ncbi:MAG TPA: o-succinylbenzoate--CoA ligase [Jiangellaceae bacterium]|nr:o-succinylbenzoate--CoA ligase [Jiangellaceae bacterium]
MPLGPAVLRRIFPAVAAALEGGPALLPVPERPALVREATLQALRPSIPVEAFENDHVALVVPTSGSCGEPKGVLLGAAAVTAAAEATHARLGGAGRWLLALPATHVAGLMILVRSVVAGTEPVAVDLTDGFDPESFAAASVHVLGGTAQRRYTALVPRQLGTILDAGGAAVDALIAYDAVLVGGSAAAPGLLDRAREAGVRVVTTYGMTETCGGCVYDGFPLDGVRLAITDEGVVQVRGPVLARGYRLRPDLTAEAFTGGWFTSADVGQMDADGRLEVSGRADDVAVSGGVNVPLVAVDAVVGDHPGVAAVASVAVPDPDWGQRVVAVLVPRDPDHPPTLESVRAHVMRRAPAAHAPKSLLIVDALPMLPSGKVDRRRLAARLRPAATA